jgi:hypothetical protein
MFIISQFLVNQKDSDDTKCRSLLAKLDNIAPLACSKCHHTFRSEAQVVNHSCTGDAPLKADTRAVREAAIENEANPSVFVDPLSGAPLKIALIGLPPAEEEEATRLIQVSVSYVTMMSSEGLLLFPGQRRFH